MALEQSSADLTLLNQSLQKARRSTDQMTTMLSDFDDRLARLEKSLVPIHKQTGRLTRISKNLEATLRSIDGLLGHHDLVDRESPLISKGPNPDDLKPYLAAMDRLVSASEALRKTDAKGQAKTLAQMTNLLQAGATQLVQVFARWTKDTSPTVDAGALVDQGKPFPPLSLFFLEHAIPLIAYLRALPDIGPSVSKELEFAYANVRAVYMEESLKNCAKDVLIDAVPAMAGSSKRRGIGRLLDVMLALAKSETSLLDTVIFLPTTRKSVYSVILPLSIGVLAATGQQLNTLVKNSLSSLVLVAFASFAELQERAPEFEKWVRGKAGRKENELGELVHAFRGTCLSSLPGFLDEVKVWGTAAPTSAESTVVGVNPMASNVVAFMRQLCDNQSTVESFLAVLGPGNWGGPSKVAPPSQNAEDSTLITRFLNDVLTTLVTALDNRSRSLRSKPGVAAIFLLNNISFLRREVLSSQIGDLLGEASEDSLNKRMRSAKASYLDIWSPLISALLDAGLDQSGAANAIKAGLGAVKGSGGGEKRETKDRFVRFHDAFEEVEALHQKAKLDEAEVEMRERLKGETLRMVVPTYTKFLAKHQAGDFSKNASKFLKLDGDELTLRMSALFDT